MRLRWRTRILPNLLTYVVLVCITAFCIFPLAWLLLTSLKLEQDIVTPVMQYIPRHVTLENYVTIWTESGFPKLVFNSALTTIYTVAICATAAEVLEIAEPGLPRMVRAVAEQVIDHVGVRRRAVRVRREHDGERWQLDRRLAARDDAPEL